MQTVYKQFFKTMLLVLVFFITCFYNVSIVDANPFQPTQADSLDNQKFLSLPKAQTTQTEEQAEGNEEPDLTPTPTSEPTPDPFAETINYYPESFTRGVENFEQDSASFCTILTHISFTDEPGTTVTAGQASKICSQLGEIQSYNEALDLQINYLIQHPATRPEHVKNILSLHDAYAETFTQLAALIENLLESTSNAEALIEAILEPQFLYQLINLLEDSSNQKHAIQDQLATIQLNLDQELEMALKQSKISVQNAILFGIIALFLLTLLSVLVFIRSGYITKPILHLTNAVVALRGNQFRPELLMDVSKRGDRLSRVALEFNKLAEEIRIEETQLDEDIQSLREELTRARRNKMIQKPTIPTSQNDHEKN